MKILNFKPRNVGSVVGTFSVEMPSGMLLHECSLMHSGEREWINPPQRQYEVNGEKKYAKLVDFISRDRKDAWESMVMAALREGGHV